MKKLLIIIFSFVILLPFLDYCYSEIITEKPNWIKAVKNIITFPKGHKVWSVEFSRNEKKIFYSVMPKKDEFAKIYSYDYTNKRFNNLTPSIPNIPKDKIKNERIYFGYPWGYGFGYFDVDNNGKDIICNYMYNGDKYYVLITEEREIKLIDDFKVSNQDGIYKINKYTPMFNENGSIIKIERMTRDQNIQRKKSQMKFLLIYQAENHFKFANVKSKFLDDTTRLGIKIGSKVFGIRPNGGPYYYKNGIIFAGQEYGSEESTNDLYFSKNNEIKRFGKILLNQEYIFHRLWIPNDNNLNRLFILVEKDSQYYLYLIKTT